MVALVVSGTATLLFGYLAYFCWFVADPGDVAAGLLWLAVALAAPVADLLARCVGMRGGSQGPVLLTRVSATALVTTLAAFCLYFRLHVLAALLL